jgi:hypothetical protein
MNELVYKLNYPELKTVFTENFLFKLLNTDEIVKNSILQKIHNEYVRFSDTVDIIKSDFRTHDSYVFDEVEVFLKINGYRGILHRDSVHDYRSPWGINWVIEGTGIMEYYDESQLTVRLTSAGTILTKNRTNGYSRYYTSRSGNEMIPMARYVMNPGVYLINGAIPHVASGMGHRIVISARSSKDYNLSWDTVVSRFHDKISKIEE